MATFETQSKDFTNDFIGTIRFNSSKAPFIRLEDCYNHYCCIEASTEKLKQAVKGFARVFSSELGLDSPVQYPEYSKKNVRFYLIAEELPDGSYKAIGAFCFANLKRLEWVWVHPYYRGKGIFKALWFNLVEKYPVSWIYNVASRQMLSFCRQYHIKHTVDPTFYFQDPSLRE